VRAERGEGGERRQSDVCSGGKPVEQVQINSGPARVVATGTVMTFAGNPIELVFGPSSQPLKLVLAFHDEEDNAELRVDTEAVDPKTLRLTLHNFRSPLGSGNTTPMQLGALGGQYLYLNFVVHCLSHGRDKLVHYTLYQSEEVISNE
jgi:hypothetical protein